MSNVNANNYFVFPHIYKAVRNQNPRTSRHMRNPDFIFSCTYAHWRRIDLFEFGTTDSYCTIFYLERDQHFPCGIFQIFGIFNANSSGWQIIESKIVCVKFIHKFIRSDYNIILGAL